MKLITYIFAFSLIFLCGSKVKLVDATSQEWAGGRYESGYGTYYKLTLVAKGSSEKLQINDLWIGDDHIDVEAYKNPVRKGDQTFERRDTVYIQTGITFKPDENGKYQKSGTTKKVAPRQFKGDAMLGYTWKGKDRYLKVDSFRKLKKLIYP